ncbi:hypothetical protein [Exiguobacterium profundum]|uniref:hypothetical protein n=1 Tax=Exiguobacterium profundum TaxID=307643 RepID=UPI00351747C6
MANDKHRWILAPIEIVYYLICYIGISLIWQLYEWTRYGEVAPNWFDSLIACLFAYVIILLYKLNKELKLNILKLNQYREAYHEAVYVVETMYGTRDQLEEIKRLKQDDQSELLYALERYVEPDFYCILNDREVFEVHGLDDLRPVGSLAREKLSSVYKT